MYKHFDGEDCPICYPKLNGKLTKKINDKTFKYKGQEIIIPNYKTFSCDCCEESFVDEEEISRTSPILQEFQNKVIMEFKKIPKFKTEDEEREFWVTHDSTDYINWSGIDYKKALKIAEELIKSDPSPDSVEGRQLNCIVDLIIDYEADMDIANGDVIGPFDNIEDALEALKNTEVE